MCKTLLVIIDGIDPIHIFADGWPPEKERSLLFGFWLCFGPAPLWVPKWSTCRPLFWFHLVPVPPKSLSSLTLRGPALICSAHLCSQTSVFIWWCNFLPVWVMDPRLSLRTLYSCCRWQQNFFSMTLEKFQSPGLSGESVTSMVSVVQHFIGVNSVLVGIMCGLSGKEDMQFFLVSSIAF